MNKVLSCVLQTFYIYEEIKRTKCHCYSGAKTILGIFKTTIASYYECLKSSRNNSKLIRGSLNLGEETEINIRNEKVATGNPHVISDILLNREDIKKYNQVSR